jgi:hypothetical protein
MADVNFFVAGGPASGLGISGLALGTFDHIGFFGPSGVGDQIEVGDANDITWLVDDAGNVPFGEQPVSGEMINNKWLDASGVSISGGSRQQLSTVVSSGSGTLLIRVTETSAVEVQSARLYAYNGTDVNVSPTNVHVLSYEIITPDKSGLGDTQWAVMDATNFNGFVDHIVSVGYSADTDHDFTVGISVRPKAGAASGIENFGFRFQADVI